MRQLDHFFFAKWCSSNQVDLRAAPVKSITDFLSYLFWDRKLQPSTIDGYRSAIADKLAIPPLTSVRVNISFVSLIASTETDPKGGGASPPETSPWFQHLLTKAPFEPIKEASWKHLTFKTVFLLALGSGKRKSEIHSWQNKNIRLVKGFIVPLTQLSFQEPAGQRGPR